ncbi:MAG: hypothetical protein U0487_03840 [Patescibacteria group bacterium]
MKKHHLALIIATAVLSVVTVFVFWPRGTAEHRKTGLPDGQSATDTHTGPGLTQVKELDVPQVDVSSTLLNIAQVTGTTAIIKDSKPPQFVTLAFDGSRSLDFGRSLANLPKR